MLKSSNSKTRILTSCAHDKKLVATRSDSSSPSNVSSQTMNAKVMLLFLINRKNSPPPLFHIKNSLYGAATCIPSSPIATRRSAHHGVLLSRLLLSPCLAFFPPPEPPNLFDENPNFLDNKDFPGAELAPAPPSLPIPRLPPLLPPPN